MTAGLRQRLVQAPGDPEAWRLAAASAVPEDGPRAIRNLQRACAAAPGDVAAGCELGQRLAASGEIGAACRHLLQLAQRVPGDPRTHHLLGRLAMQLRDPALYFANLRKLASLDPDRVDRDGLEQVVLARDLSESARCTACAVLGYRPDPPRDSFVFNTFPRVPTSAPEVALIRLFGLERSGLQSANNLKALAFDRWAAGRGLRSRRLARAHVPASTACIACFKLLDVRPVVIVRDIFETIAAYAGDRTEPRMVPGYTLATLDLARQRRVLLQRMASELVDFHATWQIAEAKGWLPGGVTVYRWEEVHTDWAGFLAGLLAERGYKVPADRIAAALPEAPPPRPAPVAFTEEEKALVRELYAQWPNVDFSAIDPGAR